VPHQGAAKQQIPVLFELQREEKKHALKDYGAGETFETIEFGCIRVTPEYGAAYFQERAVLRRGTVGFLRGTGFLCTGTEGKSASSAMDRRAGSDLPQQKASLKRGLR
jgi:hypothetical protein